MIDHDCRENTELNGDYTTSANTVKFYGKCSICGNKMVEIFKYDYTEEYQRRVV